MTSPAMGGNEIVTTERLRILLLGSSLAEAFARYRDRNRAHFAMSAPPPPDGPALVQWAHKAAAQAEREWADDASVRLVMVSKTRDRGDELSGHVMFTQIARGPMQACYLGFGLDEKDVGRGLMREALEVSIRFLFEKKQLHRIMANHTADNLRSARTLRGLGFVPEGYARDYLFLAGAWRDHVLTSLTNPSTITP